MMESLQLPLQLQDLCLLEVINDLDGYPVDLLASLPLWLRCHLLNNLPVLDLCRLDHTLAPVARGVDVDEIWKSLVMPSIFYDEDKPRSIPDSIPSGQRLPVPLAHGPFLLEPWIRHSKWYIDRYIVRPIDIPDLDPELAAAFRGIPEQFQGGEYTIIKYGRFLMTNNAREKCLLKAAVHLLDRLEWMDNSSKSYVRECKVVFEWLISIPRGGDLLTRNKYSDETKDCKVWNTHATALAKYQGVNGETQLAPHRLLPIHDREDLLELLSLLTEDCGLQPSEIAINSMSLAKSVRKRFPDKVRRKKCKSLLKIFLKNVVVLGLWGHTTDFDRCRVDADMCRTIIEGVIGDGKNCQLRVLYCREGTCMFDTSIVETLSPSLFTLPCDPEPPRYQGLSALELFSPISLGESMPYLNALLQQQISLKVVRLRLSSKDCIPSDIHQFFGTLSSLFMRPPFQTLSIKTDSDIEAESTLMLLKGFMIAPCPHVQQLTYDTGLMRRPSEMNVLKIASLDMGSENVSQCGIQHKTLLSCTHDVYHHLLHFPRIRLNDLDMWDTDGQLHTIALHPDLQLSKLRLRILSGILPDTACDDMRTLLNMPTLTELTVFGGWTQAVISALAQGLAEQAKIGSLRTVSVCTYNNVFIASNVTCSGCEFQELWDVLFFLPQLNDLELFISGDKLLELVNRYEQLIYESWKSTASGHRLKLIKYVCTKEAGDYEFALLKKVTQSSKIQTE